MSEVCSCLLEASECFWNAHLPGYLNFLLVWISSSLVTNQPLVSGGTQDSLRRFKDLKLRQIKPEVHTTPGKFENATITLVTDSSFLLMHYDLSDLGLLILLQITLKERTLAKRNHKIMVTSRFRIVALFSKCFLSTWQRTAGVFKFLRFKKAFTKISVYVTD